MTAPITMTKNEDGTYSVLYFGKPCGVIYRSKQRDDVYGRWVAITNHNEVKRLHSLDAARSYLIGSFF